MTGRIVTEQQAEGNWKAYFADSPEKCEYAIDQSSAVMALQSRVAREASGASELTLQNQDKYEGTVERIKFMQFTTPVKIDGVSYSMVAYYPSHADIQGYGNTEQEARVALFKAKQQMA